MMLSEPIPNHLAPASCESATFASAATKTIAATATH
jgi:hypothetical protein